MSGNRMKWHGIEVVVALTLALAACQIDNETPRGKGPVLSSSSSSGNGGAAGGGGAGGSAGQGGDVAMGGGGVMLPDPYCGDLTINAGEECDDGNNDTGDGCSADCLIESSETESNNSAAEATPFKDIPPYFAKIDPAEDVDYVAFSVSNANASVVARILDVGDGACAKGQIDSVIDVVAADGATVLATDDDSGEGFCSRAELPKLGVGNYFVRIAAAAKASTSTFVYRLRVDQIVDICGDGEKTIGEACDDGNTMSGDGCSATCTIEITEVEPNDATAQANAFKAPWSGVLSTMSDMDVVSVNVPSTGMSLTATTTDQGTNACAAKTLDTIVEIVAPNGTTVLAMGDDIIGNCGSAFAQNLSAGTHFVRVKGGSLVTIPSPYGLEIILQ